MGSLKNDTFAGIDGNTLHTYDVKWALAPYGVDPVIKTNAVACGSSAYNVARYDGLTWPNDQYSQITVVAVPDIMCGPCVRMDTGTVGSHYMAGVDPNDYGHSRYAIWKRIAGAFTSLAVHGSQTMQVGDVVKLTVTGTTLTLSVNGTDLGLAPTDSALASGSAGAILWHTVANVAILDTFDGGDLVSGTTPLVGAGTLTGIASRMDLGITGRSMIRG